MGRSRSARPSRRKRASARTPVDRLHAICLALPETTEKLAWGEPTWRVGGLVGQAYREVAPPRLRAAVAATRSGRR